MSTRKRWGWVRILHDSKRASMFEACALIPDGLPGDGWISCDDKIVDLLFAMQSQVFDARAALDAAKTSIHRACDTVEQARRSAGGS